MEYKVKFYDAEKKETATTLTAKGGTPFNKVLSQIKETAKREDVSFDIFNEDGKSILFGKPMRISAIKC